MRVRTAMAATVVVAAVGLTGCTGSPRTTTTPVATSTRGNLTEREFTVARDIARAQADRLADSITSATATVAPGTEARHNVGPPCTSGTLLHIKLIGTFHTSHGGVPGQSYEPVSAVLITADPETGPACLLSVSTGQQAPDPGAGVLFTK